MKQKLYGLYDGLHIYGMVFWVYVLMIS